MANRKKIVQIVLKTTSEKICKICVRPSTTAPPTHPPYYIMRYNLLIICLLSALAAAAEPDSLLRPVVSGWAAEVGSSHLRDTYLTPVQYSGWHAAVDYERLQVAPFGRGRWVMQLRATVNLGSTDNRRQTATMWHFNFRPEWALMHRFTIPALAPVKFAAGGIASANVGGLYLLRNSNNPVSLQASATVGATAMAWWNTRLASRPLTLRYQADMPVVGAFFAPDYDQLYYEIYLGNRSGLCHAAWPGNFFRLNNLLTADWRFGSNYLRLGYRLEVFSSKAAGIVSRRVEHSFVIGFTTEWLAVGTRHKPDAAILSPLY